MTQLVLCRVALHDATSWQTWTRSRSTRARSSQRVSCRSNIRRTRCVKQFPESKCKNSEQSKIWTPVLTPSFQWRGLHPSLHHFRWVKILYISLLRTTLVLLFCRWHRRSRFTAESRTVTLCSSTVSSKITTTSTSYWNSAGDGYVAASFRFLTVKCLQTSDLILQNEVHHTTLNRDALFWTSLTPPLPPP